MLLLPCKRSLWAALRAARRGDMVAAIKSIQEALVYLELDARAVDPSLKL